MKTKAAIIWKPGTDWSVEQIDLDPPRADEVLVELAASGMCHSDEHLVTGDSLFELPFVGGHEGAGVVVETGPGVRSLAPGDHVVFSFIPACGRCPSCAAGHSNLCDLGMQMFAGRQVKDQTARHHKDGVDLGLMCLLGTFAEHTVVNEASCVKIDPGYDLRLACLLGCGVITGWGSAVYSAQVRPGEDVAVVGVGGVGINAVQGAVLAGAGRVFAIDPVQFKRDKAVEFGATHTAESLAVAFDLVQHETRGKMADKVILAVGLGDGRMWSEALAITAKRGRLVITNIHTPAENQVSVNPLDLTLMEKQIVGSLFGSANPRVDIHRLLQLYQEGKLKLDELVTRTYRLGEINMGYDDMRHGRNLRGVIKLD